MEVKNGCDFDLKCKCSFEELAKIVFDVGKDEKI